MASNKHPAIGWLWIVPAIGVLMIVGAIAIGVARMRFEAEALRADGEIIGLRESTSRDSDGNISTTYCPQFRFTDVRGRVFDVEASGCSKPAGYAIGERVPVLYRAAAPQRASLDGFTERWLASVVVGGIGLVFLIIGLAFVLPMLAARRRARELSASGRPVTARVVEVARFNGLKINGRSPWRIHAQWQDTATGMVHVVHSDNLRYDPTPYVGETIRVMIDPQRPSRHWVDTSTLPELA